MTAGSSSCCWFGWQRSFRRLAPPSRRWRKSSRCKPASRLLAESDGMRCRLLQGEQDGCGAAHDAEQEDRRIDIDVGQHVAYQHQLGRDWDAVSVSQDKNEDRNECDDLSQRQPVQKRSQLDDKDFPQQIAKSRRLIEGPFLPELFPHGCPCISPGACFIPQCGGWEASCALHPADLILSRYF